MDHIRIIIYDSEDDYNLLNFPFFFLDGLFSILLNYVLTLDNGLGNAYEYHMCVCWGWGPREGLMLRSKS